MRRQCALSKSPGVYQSIYPDHILTSGEMHDLFFLGGGIGWHLYTPVFIHAAPLCHLGSIGQAVLILGCDYGHLKVMMVAGIYAPYNAGIMIWLNDLALPAILLALLWAPHQLKAKGAEAR